MKTFAYIATVALVSMVGIGTANAKSDIHVTINAGGVRAVVEAPAHERHPEVRTVVVTRPVVVGAGHTVYVAPEKTCKHHMHHKHHKHCKHCNNCDKHMDHKVHKHHRR
ncbi:MAG: hypothetical protein IKR89_06810 [Bacteroidaceae bacterium]|nr:hypothetical protein [Bacteroidaceae bacterium]MBR6368052.1 hypothetical protein [Bacteroidaceae bacterium]